MSNDNRATVHNLDTSEGARAYVAEFFANQVRRHDFRAYITTRLAADFACALAKHLAAQPSPAGQGDLLPPQSEWMLPDDSRIAGLIADSIEQGKLDHVGFYRNTQLAEVLRRVLSAALAAPPAQAVDLGQLSDLHVATLRDMREHMATGTLSLNDWRGFGTAALDAVLAPIDSQAVRNG